MSATWQWLSEVSGATIYYAHSICITSDPVLMALYVAADMTTYLSYMVIGITLLVYRVSTIRMSRAALTLYGAFIFLCGLSHLTKTLTLFAGIYRIDIMVVALMAAVSAVTAVLTVSETRLASLEHP